MTMTEAVVERKGVRRIGRLEVGTPRAQRAPGPEGGGMLGSLGSFRRDPLAFLLSVADRYGDVVRLRFGPRAAHRVVHLVRHPDHVRHVLQERQGLLTSEGELWERQRRMIQPLLHRDRLTSYSETMVRSCGEMLARWDGYAGEARPVRRGR